MIDKKQIWSKLISDLDSDDIVLEIKILNTKISDYNKLLNCLNQKLNFSFDFTLGGEKKEIVNSISEDFFEQDFTREIQIDLGKINVSNTFFVSDEIEFYTNSVLRIKYEEASNFFIFIEWLGRVISKKVLIFIESHPNPSVSYDFTNKLYKSYFYSE